MTPEQFEAIRRLGTCTVSNVIETFNVRLRDEGFADAIIRCIFPQLPPMLGYAFTGRIRCSGPPPVGHSYYDRTDWWTSLASVPGPRVVVMQDVDSQPGTGAFVGEVHAHILRALGCVGVVTNGAVRDLSAVEPLGFHFFAGSVAVSHSYVHIVDFGNPVEIGGLLVRPGDLIHGDRHGILSIPKDIAAEIPARAEQILKDEQKLIELCQSSDFSTEKLREAIKEMG